PTDERSIQYEIHGFVFIFIIHSLIIPYILAGAPVSRFTIAGAQKQPKGYFCYTTYIGRYAIVSIYTAGQSKHAKGNGKY
ncbi:MAG: hypothetical protein IJ641_06160, partial [Lachnospiraceae bacterium]|nr:hypothetical protein [Lachnospiraceae bacterium]